MKAEGTPFKMVLERSHEMKRVTKDPETNQGQDHKACPETRPTSASRLKKIVPKAMNSGNLPLQGIKLLVRIAISLPGRVDDSAGSDPCSIAA